ncbi:hypothetical protein CEN49_20130 [Fischerella thermalis CCMEE 5273]|uniref:helix-turn-helix domain-containing protein n=1 Tax=Chlorogloeopsis fritschii TaxID=1124 RepID=UPI0009DABC08|nr:hypothetical protein CEN49_20130 [Fischerella thermalis CCMEE 5273]PMB49129.1 hypothetical protein CEN40_05725 [Fischerella thermalis CCMEE 5205]
MNLARVLLKADINQEGGSWTDGAIAKALDISVTTIERLKRRFVESGLEATINRKPQPESNPHNFNHRSYCLGDTEKSRLADC